MAIAYNTSIVRDGLVMHLDAANQKSWSPNVHPKPLDIYTWAAPGGAFQMTLSQETGFTSPAGGRPMKMITAGLNSPYTGSYNSASWNLAPAASGQTWTFSFWVKGSSNFTASAMIFGSNSSGAYLELGQPTYNVTTEWTRVSGSYTLTNASTTHIQFRFDVYVNGVTMWADGLQIERASSASAFSPLTNTNGTVWYDISGNAKHGTCESGVTYALLSGVPSLYFDGTNDRVSFSNPLSQPNLAQTWTVSAWINNTDKVAQTLVGGLNLGCDVSYSTTTNSLLYLNSGVNDYYTYGGDLSNLGWILATFRFRNSDGARTIYRNTTNISTGGPNATSTPSGQASTFYLGHGGAGYLQGNVSSLMIYNRYISDAELTHNFNAYRDRFGV